MFEIRLTIEKEHADQMLQAFIASVPQFDVKVMQQENSSVLMQLTTAKRPSNTGFRGGRPKKLTPDQVSEIRTQLFTDPHCNRTQLGRKYGVSYAMVLKIAKGQL